MKKLVMSPSSTVHGGQHDTKYVTFELLLHAAFVADEMWGFMLVSARNLLVRTCNYKRVNYLVHRVVVRNPAAYFLVNHSDHI